MDRVLRAPALPDFRLWRRAASGLPNRSEAQHVMVGRHSIYNVQLVAGSGATRAFLLGQKKTWISRDISAFTHVFPRDMRRA
jgi:hypothetical protein